MLDDLLCWDRLCLMANVSHGQLQSKFTSADVTKKGLEFGDNLKSLIVSGNYFESKILFRFRYLKPKIAIVT